ncbi:MAG: SAM-dependent methyltransferase [Phenylobacterium sp.]|jgi:FkbM family methyltransferase|nr:SAM-dependent methyltransferase [Phenylobacterium sp.]
MATKTYPTRHGPMLAFTGDRFMTPPLEQRGEYAPEEWAILDQLTQPRMTVVEIGANIGTHTIPLARKCAPGPLFAFEPQQRVFQVLCANLALNDIGNVLAYPDACGEAEGWAAMPMLDYDAVQNFGGVSLQPADQPGMKVRVIALDSLELPTLGLLKIDVEGFEPMVLRGARQTIARCRPVIYVENDRPEQQGEVIGLLAEMGYVLYWHVPRLSDPEVFDGMSYASVNMLCFPSETGSKVAGAQPIDPENWQSPVPVERL